MFVRITLLHSESYLGFRDKGSARDSEAAVHCAEILTHDGQTTSLFAACAGC